MGENERVQQVELLSSVNDLYGGVRVNMEHHPMDSKDFATSLKASISQWKQQGKRGVWIKLPIEQVNLVEVAVKVLVVMENGGRFKETGVWKFPTGVVNEGEDICTAAVREVKEETGIDAEFVEVLAFRESHKSFFSKSDLFFVCMLKPRSFDIQKQDQEVEAAQWMPFEEYAAQPFIREHELFNYVAKICLAKSDKGYAGFSPVSAATSSGKTSCLYCNNPDIHLLTSGHQ
ncbi:nudix hydrolase 2-like isoform X2 [Corylus avellana]|uniref:nudix hydrolase 2-like isoform X2 n=1 Tax=Corylus avellana TaxID=13451 RepID=UPI00286C4166|nr:nudix hydrolase 2-like isoform X2 [Corylus avellana]